MKRVLLSLLVALAVLPACRPLPPEIPLPEVPSRQFLAALEQRRSAFPGLRAVASATTVRKGKKRVFESVGIVVDREHRFRIEAFDPLGAPFVTLVWNGSDLLLRTSDGRLLQPGPAGLEKLAGPGISPEEFAAVLTGNVPDAGPGVVRSFCGDGGRCVTEFRSGNFFRRVRTLSTQSGILIEGYDVYRGGDLLYRAEFGDETGAAGYRAPATVTIDQPRSGTKLIVAYTDVETGAPADDAWLRLPAQEDQEP